MEWWKHSCICKPILYDGSKWCGGMYPHFGVNFVGNTTPSDYAMAVGVHQSGTIVTPSGNWSGNGNGWDAPIVRLTGKIAVIIITVHIS